MYVPQIKLFFPRFFEQQRQTSTELPDKVLRAVCPWNKQEQVTGQYLPPSAKTQLSKQALSETTFHLSYGETRYYLPIRYVYFLAD